MRHHEPEQTGRLGADNGAAEGRAHAAQHAGPAQPARPAGHVARAFHRLGRAGLLGLSLIMAMPASLHAQIERLPDLGSADSDELSNPAERRLGESVMRQLRSDGTVYDDAEMNDFINRFGSRLTGTEPARGQPFLFFVVRDDSINAFALPGGFIGVNTGLLFHPRLEDKGFRPLSNGWRCRA